MIQVTELGISGCQHPHHRFTKSNLWWMLLIEIKFYCVIKGNSKSYCQKKKEFRKSLSMAGLPNVFKWKLSWKSSHHKNSFWRIRFACRCNYTNVIYHIHVNKLQLLNIPFQQTITRVTVIPSRDSTGSSSGWQWIWTLSAQKKSKRVAN